MGGPEPGEEVRAERIVIGLRLSFHRERFHDLTETYELTIDGEPYTVEVRDGALETRPGAASSPAIELRTDADTLVALLTGELAPGDALARDRAVLEGERSALRRFVEAFAFGPQ
jgi:alkyl sulfatase BDS1-like metallo-beta-lactamase superfamily hydrolase